MQACDASPHRPDVTLDQLAELEVTQGHLDDLLDGHQELAETHLKDGGPVHGVGITAHHVDGTPTGKAALLVLVESLDGLAALPAVNARGVPILYEAVGEITAAAGYTTRYRPIAPGISIAPVGTPYAGTMGAVVQVGGKQHILSCNHVLANTNALPAGSPINQPAQRDGGGPQDVIAKLAYTVPLVFNAPNKANAAIAAVDPGVVATPGIMRDNGAAQALASPVLSPAFNLRVCKSGRTTGYTQGAIQSIGLMLRVAFPGPRYATFLDTFGTSPTGPSGQFALAGDSGALVTSMTNQPVGMIIAVTSAATIPLAFATPLPEVLSELSRVAGQPVTLVYN